jgi:hypothetical protein
MLTLATASVNHLLIIYEDLRAIKALLDLIDEFYAKNSIEFNFLISDSENSRMIDNIGSSSDGNFLYQVKDVNVLDHLDKSAVILVRDVHSFNNINLRVKLTNYYPKDLKFIVVLDDPSELTISLITREYLINSKGIIEDFAYFFVNIYSEIHLMTILHHNEISCGPARLLPVNVYLKYSQKWAKKLNSFKKFTNFHNCPLTVTTMHHFYGQLYIDKFQKKVQGLLFDLIMPIAQQTNFTPVIIFSQDNSLSDSYFDQTGQETFQVAHGVKTNIPYSHDHITTIFNQNSYIFVITPADPYTSYEKMLLPFDKDTWTWLIVTFSCTFVVIFIINRISKKVQDLVYGENVQTPTMNVFFIFFGIGQMKLPAKWFARFLLMNFILFCLIFRTCYQSKMFEFMTSDMRKSSPETVDDLFVQNFTIYTMDYAHIVRNLENLIEEKRR